MRSLFRAGCAGLVLFVFAGILNASSIIPLPTDQLVQASGAIFRGTVVGAVAFKDTDGLIYTRTSLRVIESFKGKLPVVVRVVHRGGQVGTEDEFSGSAPRFVPGGEFLLFVHRRPDGRLECTQGSASAVPLGSTEASSAFSANLLAELWQLGGGGVLPGEDVTDQSGSVSQQMATGMLNGIASRFLQPDRGEPIPYLIDANSANLPAGMTMTQATNAVQQAFNAWTAVTSLKFKLEGLQSFGQGADTITNNDEKIRIQLHDNYGRINGAGTLGIGGRNSRTSPLPGAGWDLGGNIAGNEFRQTMRGYVVLETTEAAMQNLATFTEVLCHEIGHSLSMAHSSENPSEPNATLKQAIMYYSAHADGRGATLGSYDIPIVQQVYPFNTAPYTYSRVLDVVTSPNTPAVAGINEVELRSYDLQTASLSMATTNSSGLNGTFSFVGKLAKYAPGGYYGDQTRFDPSEDQSYDSVYARFSDGTNSSPYAAIRVISFNADSDFPVASDGLPDNWMVQYFGHTAPQAGDKSRAQDDADGDGINNLNEFRAGMNPKSAASAQRITLINATNLQWQAKAYELYEVLGSTNLTTWSRAANLVVPTNSIGSVSLSSTNARQFFRVLKVP